jgi:hypothetical protein
MRCAVAASSSAASTAVQVARRTGPLKLERVRGAEKFQPHGIDGPLFWIVLRLTFLSASQLPCVSH